MKHIAILCSLLLSLLGLASAQDLPASGDGDKHILKIALTVVIEDDLGGFHMMPANKLEGLKVQFAGDGAVVEEIMDGKNHKMAEGQNLVVVAVAGDAPAGQQDLTVSHPTFGAETVKWSLSDDGRPEVRLELLQNN